MNDENALDNKKRALAQHNLSDAMQEYEPARVGKYSCTLDYKIWGKSVNLWIFLTSEQGEKIRVSCFRSYDDRKIYAARDGIYDFSQAGNEGRKFVLEFGANKNGTIAFLTAEEFIALTC